jgi:signal transduction histidine kinase
VSVSDEGPGIPPELRERVFEKFFRIPGREPFDSRRGGIGLGLSIARQLAESQAGALRIDQPAAGYGTSVVLTLPVRSDLIARRDTNASAAAVPV